MKIYRKRYIPNEIVDISNDKVVSFEDDVLVTQWRPIHPRNDIAYGKSYTFLKKGWKISQFYNKNNEFLYWYCDIIEVKVKEDEYTFIDLLVDVVVEPDGNYKIVDLDELDEAVKKGLIDEDKKKEALEKMNALVKQIESGHFPPKECK